MKRLIRKADINLEQIANNIVNMFKHDELKKTILEVTDDVYSEDKKVFGTNAYTIKLEALSNNRKVEEQGIEIARIFDIPYKDDFGNILTNKELWKRIRDVIILVGDKLTEKIEVENVDGKFVFMFDEDGILCLFYEKENFKVDENVDKLIKEQKEKSIYNMDRIKKLPTIIMNLWDKVREAETNEGRSRDDQEDKEMQKWIEEINELQKEYKELNKIYKEARRKRLKKESRK